MSKPEIDFDKHPFLDRENPNAQEMVKIEETVQDVKERIKPLQKQLEDLEKQFKYKEEIYQKALPLQRKNEVLFPASVFANRLTDPKAQKVNTLTEDELGEIQASIQVPIRVTIERRIDSGTSDISFTLPNGKKLLLFDISNSLFIQEKKQERASDDL